MAMKRIIVAGGCFWGVEEYYRRLKGIAATKVGYAQGHVVNPSYYEVKKGDSDHAEVVQLDYDDAVISLKQILDHLFRMIDPTSLNQQGEDIGSQYRTGIYYIDVRDLPIIRAFIAEKQKQFAQKIMVEVELLSKFYDAEDYHQEYLVKNPRGYCHVDFSKMKDNEKK